MCICMCVCGCACMCCVYYTNINGVYVICVCV